MVEVKKGDKVTIEAMGIQVSGTVVYSDFAKDYINGGGYWDIELKEANVAGGYSHWKQEFDGGKIVAVNGKDI